MGLFITVILIIIFLFLVCLRVQLLKETIDSILGVVKQKKKKMESLHKLNESNINNIVFKQNAISIEIKDFSKIQDFKNILKQAKIHKIKYIDVPKSAVLTIRATDNTLIRDISILIYDDKDIFFELIHEYPKYVVSVPGLKSWFNENIFSKI